MKIESNRVGYQVAALAKIGLGIALLAAFLCTVQVAAAQSVVHEAGVNNQSPAVETRSDFIEEFPLPGDPNRLVVEAPGKIWFTMPASNSIGSLVVTDTLTGTTSHKVTLYELTTADSQPYDLVLDESRQAVWYTAPGANLLGRLDMMSGDVVEFPLPTANSQPLGIAQAPNGTVWLVAQRADAVVGFNPDTKAFAEYPVTYAGKSGPSGLTDIGIAGNNDIWLTAADEGEILNFLPSGPSFTTSVFGSGRPVAISMESSGGRPWIVDQSNGRLAWFAQGTFTFWGRLDVSSPERELAAIYIDESSRFPQIWFAEKEGNSVGRGTITGSYATTFLFKQPVRLNSKPTDIMADSDGSGWIALSNGKAIARWRAPYAHFSYLPSIFDGE